MLLVISDELLKDLKVIGTFSLEVVREFCKVSGESIFKGTNSKMLNSAASKLGTTTEVIKSIIEGLMKLFVEASKLQLQDSDFNLSLKVLNLPDEIEREVMSKYQDISSEIRDVLRLKEPPCRKYRDLEWRLDVKLATRSLHHQVEPNFLLKLHTSQTGGSAEIPPRAEINYTLLEADPQNLKHLTKSLEEALREVDEQAHCRRIVRNF